MENISDEWKEGFARAQKAEAPTAQTRQIVNILNCLNVPTGISISQELANFFVQTAMQRGIKVPAAQLTAVEMRSLKTQVMKACPDFDIKIDSDVRKQLISKLGTTVKKSAPQQDNKYQYWSDDMLIMANNLHKDALLAEELKAHPLLALSMKRDADSRQQLPQRRIHKKR